MIKRAYFIRSTGRKGSVPVESWSVMEHYSWRPQPAEVAQQYVDDRESTGVTDTNIIEFKRV